MQKLFKEPKWTIYIIDSGHRVGSCALIPVPSFFYDSRNPDFSLGTWTITTPSPGLYLLALVTAMELILTEFWLVDVRRSGECNLRACMLIFLLAAFWAVKSPWEWEPPAVEKQDKSNLNVKEVSEHEEALFQPLTNQPLYLLKERETNLSYSSFGLFCYSRT